MPSVLKRRGAIQPVNTQFNTCLSDSIGVHACLWLLIYLKTHHQC